MFEEIYKDKYIREIYSKVDEFEEKNKAWAHHNLNHAIRVNSIAETLLRNLKYNIDIIEDTKIACILHDIGCIKGKENHALRSFIMAKEYFENMNIKLKNKEMILEAIKDHSNGFDSDNIITLTLLIADKLDINKRRIAPTGYSIIGMRQIQYIEEIKIDIEDKLLKINFIVNKVFDYKEFENFYFMKKIIKSVNSFCIVNKLDYVFMINDEIWENL